jgi:hypothetical protein
MTGVHISPIQTPDERCVTCLFPMASLRSVLSHSPIRRAACAPLVRKRLQNLARANIGYRCLVGFLRSINWLPFLEISQNREAGEGREEMFERMSTEDKVRIDYMINELKQFGDGV